MPTIKVSRTRKAIMYSFTRTCTASHADRMQIGVSKVDNNTKNSEMPSTPIL